MKLTLLSEPYTASRRKAGNSQRLVSFTGQPTGVPATAPLFYRLTVSRQEYPLQHPFSSFTGNGKPQAYAEQDNDAYGLPLNEDINNPQGGGDQREESGFLRLSEFDPAPGSKRLSHPQRRSGSLRPAKP